MCRLCKLVPVFGRYCIMLNFQGSKFSRIASLENFVKILSRIRYARTPHTYTMGVAYEPGWVSAILPTPISPTKNHIVPFRLLSQKKFLTLRQASKQLSLPFLQLR